MGGGHTLYNLIVDLMRVFLAWNIGFIGNNHYETNIMVNMVLCFILSAVLLTTFPGTIPRTLIEFIYGD